MGFPIIAAIAAVETLLKIKRIGNWIMRHRKRKRSIEEAAREGGVGI